MDRLSSKRVTLILVLLLIFGFVLRSIVANNLSPSADESVYGTHAINFFASGATSNQNQSPVWFYLADVFYKIFGVTLFSSRFTSILYSTFTIIIIFLLTKKLFDIKTALIASFLFTFSSYALEFTLMEMDATFTFFYVLSLYFFISKLFEEDKISLLSGLFYGIAVLTKAISIMLAPGFVLVYLVYFLRHKEKRKVLVNRNNILRALIVVITILVFMTPILSYNYLLYKEKGLTDIMFARFFDVSEDFYSSISPTLQSFSPSLLIEKGLKQSFIFFYEFDPLILFLFLTGVLLSLFKKNLKMMLLILAFLPTYLFLSGTSLLGNHFLVFIPLFAIGGALTCVFFLEKLKNNKTKKYALIFFCILFISFNLFSIRDILTSQSAVGQLREFAIENIDEKTLVLVDNRIYGGRTAWLFNDKHYLEVSNIDAVIKAAENLPTQEIQIKTIFVECSANDCGWGTVTQGPLNDSMELFSAQIKDSAKKVAEFNAGGGDRPITKPYFEVYGTTSSLKPEVLEIVDQTHIWFYYPVRWQLKERIYDSYTPKGFIDKSIDAFAKLILYLALTIALLTPLFLIHRIYKEYKKETPP